MSSIQDVSILQNPLLFYFYRDCRVSHSYRTCKYVRREGGKEKKEKKDQQARKRNKSTYRVPCRSCHSHSCRSVYTGTGVHLIVRGPRRGYVGSSRHDEVLSGVMDMSPLSSGISGGIPGHSQYTLLFTGQQ